MKSLESIRNFVQLTPLHGTAGQPRREQISDIASAGFECVINLAMPDHPDSIDDEGALVTALGMDYCHLPVPFEAPTVDHWRRFSALLEAEGERLVFVHCIMNYRVSAFMYLYLTRLKGYPVKRARSPILDRWQIEPQWQVLMASSDADLGISSSA